MLHFLGETMDSKTRVSHFRPHWAISKRCNNTVLECTATMREEEAQESVLWDLGRWKKGTTHRLTAECLIYHRLLQTRGEEPIPTRLCTRVPTKLASQSLPCTTGEVAMHVGFQFFTSLYIHSSTSLLLLFFLAFLQQNVWALTRTNRNVNLHRDQDIFNVKMYLNVEYSWKLFFSFSLLELNLDID